MIDDILVIVNPLAGSARKPETIGRIVSLLASYGTRPTCYVTSGPGDATKAATRAVEKRVNCVAVVGGDGTVGEVIGPLVGTGLPLAVIPMGTANAFARELGLPLENLPLACRIAAEGHTWDVDVGVCNGIPFAMMFGTGFDAEVALWTEQQAWKHYLGRWAFVGQAFQCLFRERPRRFIVNVDGETMEVWAWAVVACNGEMYSWRLKFAPGARLDDGKLDLLAFPHQGRAQLLVNVGWHWLNKGQSPLRNVIHKQGQHIKIEAEPPARWQADGEPRGTTPVEIGIKAGALRVVVSKSSQIARADQWRNTAGKT
ncbi:MAG: diacylglycerol/lipid kinase family protein [Candidatus Zipacnadales bacterium]